MTQHLTIGFIFTVKQAEMIYSGFEVEKAIMFMHVYISNNVGYVLT